MRIGEGFEGWNKIGRGGFSSSIMIHQPSWGSNGGRLIRSNVVVALSFLLLTRLRTGEILELEIEKEKG